MRGDPFALEEDLDGPGRSAARRHRRGRSGGDPVYAVDPALKVPRWIVFNVTNPPEPKVPELSQFERWSMSNPPRPKQVTVATSYVRCALVFAKARCLSQRQPRRSCPTAREPVRRQ